MNLRKRLKLNPLELAIFGLVSGIFIHSTVKLIEESREFRAAALSAKAQTIAGAARSLASNARTQAYLSLELDCQAELKRETQARKVRLSGSFCSASGPVKAAVLNQANQYNATVFQDSARKTYSTDYIPLQTGSNSISVRLTGTEGTTFVQTLAIEKSQ